MTETKNAQQPEEELVTDQSGADDLIREELDVDAAAADVAEPPESEPEATGEAGDLEAQLEAANARANENWDRVLRMQAEMDNLRKRNAREIENAHKFALDKIATELLGVRDSLENGIKAGQAEDADVAKLQEGSELILKQLTQAMEKFNIVEVNPEGEKFDPDLHQAMSMQEVPDTEPNTVIAVLQKGYTLNDRLLRPALVMVAK